MVKKITRKVPQVLRLKLLRLKLRHRKLQKHSEEKFSLLLREKTTPELFQQMKRRLPNIVCTDYRAQISKKKTTLLASAFLEDLGIVTEDHKKK